MSTIRRRARLAFFCMAAALLILPGSLRAEPEVAVIFNTRQAAVGQEVALTIRISGAQGNIQAPHIPVPDGLESFYTGRSSNLSFVNGVSSSSVEFSYVLVGRRPGSFTLPAFDVQAGGKNLKTEPVTFEVTGQGGGVPAQGARHAASQPQGPLAPASAVQEPPAAFHPEDDNIYVVAAVDKTTAYPNEQIKLSYSLYTRYDTRYEGFSEEPEMSGFWIEEFPPDKEIRRDTVRVHGKPYVRAEIRQIALFPTAPADYTIRPGTLKASIRQEPQQSQSVFDEFFNDSFFSGGGFFSRRENRLLKPAEVQIKVIPFPEEGKPANFNGAVGSFRMTAVTDKDQVKQNEPVTLKIQIEGEGNIETLKKPGVPEMKNFKVYESDSATDLAKNGFVIGGKKTFEVVFIPLEAGEQFIPKLSFSYFDPRTRQYLTLFTPGFKLSVAESKEAAVLPQGLVSPEDLKKEITKEGQDIHYIAERLDSAPRRSAAAQASRVLWILNFLALLALAAGFLRQRQEQVFAKDASLKRRKYARANAVAKLASLKKMARSEDSKEIARFFEELDKALTLYLSDKFNLSAFGATRHGLEREIEAALGREHELYRDVLKVYSLCEEARFGRGAVSSEHRHEALVIFKKTVDIFEKVLK